ncbi:lipoprotein signal peptidase LspA [Clostridium aceticum]|uniref:Lipoprotein signal peptidase n=1 Tax=Clostridium aceticum TaxID=84022 RepID=A0A0D8IA21_9CLOT|nr:signal peptidase II [Clostridium aceticum]AKL95552.1 lipoprotein signal peptidase LspA [Clostridium aceticum]KJF26867.1 lipoprotein signal peptidase [Clostridium aceticum]
MNYIISFVVFILDQLSKILVLNYLKDVGEIPIIKNVLHFTYVENRGAAFGVLQGQRWFFIIMTVLIVGFIVIYFRKNKNYPKPMMLGLSLIVGGAAGNLVDRVLYNFVVDFIDFRIWPVFNIADSAIVIGQILVIYVILKYDDLSQKEM